MYAALLISTLIYLANADTPYVLSNQQHTLYNNADENCKNQEGRSATFSTLDDIKKMREACPANSWCFVGFKTAPNSNTYIDPFGVPIDALGAWGPNDPDPLNEKCGCVRGTGGAPANAEIRTCQCIVPNDGVWHMVCDDLGRPTTQPPAPTAPTFGVGILTPHPTAPTFGIGTAPHPTAPIIEEDRNCTAKICAHGDNTLKLDISYDSGNNWHLNVATESEWKQTLQINISPIDENTILRFTVTDAGTIGGFLCTIQICSNNGYIFEFYTDTVNTYFDVISESPNNDQLLDVFHQFGTGKWANYVNPDKVQCMNEKADWIWNNHQRNTIVFEVNFVHHLKILQRLDCVPSEDCCEDDEKICPDQCDLLTQAFLSAVEKAVMNGGNGGNYVRNARSNGDKYKHDGGDYHKTKHYRGNYNDGNDQTRVYRGNGKNRPGVWNRNKKKDRHY